MVSSAHGAKCEVIVSHVTAPEAIPVDSEAKTPPAGSRVSARMPANTGRGWLTELPVIRLREGNERQAQAILAGSERVDLSVE